MESILRFIGITKDALTAGPGKRLELFTKGCIRGVVSPCLGCFNNITWSFQGKYRQFDVNELVDIIDRDAWNRQVTFCGGEPILQARALGLVAKKLKEKDPSFHFVMYTMYKLDVLMKCGLKFTWVKDKHEEAMLPQLIDYSSSYVVKERDEDGNPYRVGFEILTAEDVKETMRHIDIIVDGEYKHEQRLTIAEYMHDGGFIGSANQRVIYTNKTMERYDKQDDHEGFEMTYVQSDEYMDVFNDEKHCKACGHSIEKNSYCNDTCMTRYENRKTQMKAISLA